MWHRESASKSGAKPTTRETKNYFGHHQIANIIVCIMTKWNLRAAAAKWAAPISFGGTGGGDTVKRYRRRRIADRYEKMAIELRSVKWFSAHHSNQTHTYIARVRT